MSELTEISKRFKEQADKLLIKTGLVEDLEKYGKVYFTGAYAGSLMMHGDVDITVVRDKPYSIEEVFEIFKCLYFKRKFRSYFIGGDWDDPRKGTEFPNGYYFGLKEKIGGERWKFDVWFISEKDFKERNKLFSINKIELTDEQREQILFFKKYRKDNKLDVLGQTIYKAVLEGKCRTIKEFENYIDKVGV